MKTKKNLGKQYNPFADLYSKLHQSRNMKSKKDFFGSIVRYAPKNLSNAWILDLGCGAGTDLVKYRKMGFKRVEGIDSSDEMCELAVKKFQKNSHNVQIYTARFDSDEFNTSNDFDLVVSKWAIQTAPKIDPVYKTAYGALKKGGIIVFLTVHPLRQFLEKGKCPKNYFKKEIVKSRIFEKQITVEEPSHTMQEYLSPYFIKHFDLLEFKEGFEFPAAEQIKGDTYPTYVIIVARRK